MAKLFQVTAHCSIILALCMAAFEVLDRFNPYMNFLGLPISTGLLAVFCLVAVMQAVRLLYCESKLGALRRELGKTGKPFPRARAGRPEGKPESSLPGIVPPPPQGGKGRHNAKRDGSAPGLFPCPPGQPCRRSSSPPSFTCWWGRWAFRRCLKPAGPWTACGHSCAPL